MDAWNISFWDEFSGAILVLGSVLLGNLPTENMYCNKRNYFSSFFAHSLPVALWLFRYVLVYTSIHLGDFSCCSTWKDGHVSWCVRFPEEVQRDEEGFLNVRDAQQGLGGLNHPNIKAKTPRVVFINWEMGKTRMYIYACTYLLILCNMYNLFSKNQLQLQGLELNKNEKDKWVSVETS